MLRVSLRQVDYSVPMSMTSNAVIPNSIVVHPTTNQSWLIVRTQVEGLDDLDNVHAVQDQYDLRPLSAYSKNFTQPLGVVDPSIHPLLVRRPRRMPWMANASLPRRRNGLIRSHFLMRTRPRVWTNFLPSSALFRGNHLIITLCLLKREWQWVSR